MRDRPKPLEVGPIGIDVTAPAALLFQMIGSIGQGSQRPGERTEILERDGDVIVCDFWTIVSLPFGRARSVRTREAMHLVPPDRIEFEHLDGPVRGLRETITVEPLGGHRSRLVYRGTYEPRGLFAGPVFWIVSRGVVERAVRSHFADLRDRAEERAARSRLFRAALGDDGGAGQPASPDAPATSPLLYISPAAAFGGPVVIVASTTDESRAAIE